MEKEDLSGHHRHEKPLLVPIRLYESSDDEREEEMLYARSTVREIQIASNFAVLKSSMSPRNNDTTTNDTCSTMPSAKRIKTQSSVVPVETNDEKEQQQQYHLAVETAMLVQKEIEQWENSIRELEIILNSHSSEPSPAPPHHYHQCHETADTIAVKNDTSTTTTTTSNHHNNDDDTPMIPQRSISVSSTETRVAAVIDEDDVMTVVDSTTPPLGPVVVWDNITLPTLPPSAEVLGLCTTTATSASSLT